MKNTYKLSDKEVTKFITRVKEWLESEVKDDEQRKIKSNEYRRIGEHNDD